MGGTSCMNGREKKSIQGFWLESPKGRASYEQNWRTISKRILERGSEVCTGAIWLCP